VDWGVPLRWIDFHIREQVAPRFVWDNFDAVLKETAHPRVNDGKKLEMGDYMLIDEKYSYDNVSASYDNVSASYDIIDIFSSPSPSSSKKDFIVNQLKKNHVYILTEITIKKLHFRKRMIVNTTMMETGLWINNYL
jgi:hypothetical protein